MFTIISRVVRYGFDNFWRNGWLSTTTVVIMILSLSVFIGLIIFNQVTDQVVKSVQDKIDISVYFKPTTQEDQILNIKQSLESLAEVKKVDYISSDEALKIFRDRHRDDVDITQALNELNENPLEASLTIKAQKSDQYASIADQLSNPSLNTFIDKVSYSENQTVIDRLNSIINNVTRGGLALTIIMAIVAGLVVFNTVRLAIYSNRDEISIMRAVGASNSLVRGPYMIEGVIAGVLAAVFSMIFAAPFVYFASPYFSALAPELNVFKYFYSNVFVLLGYQVLFGVLIGTFSSFVAVRRYLKN